MKKLFTFMSIAIVALLSSVPVKAILPLTETYVPNANLRSLLSNNFSTYYDATYRYYYISDNTLYNTTEITLDVKGYGITSFKGLEYFQNLQHLTCTNMSNTTVDMTYLQQVDILTLNNCNRLSSNFISGNPQDLQFITLNNCSAISSINLTGCPALTDLRVVKCPAVTSINTNVIPTLEMLCISGSDNLTSLDLTTNTELRVLDFYGTGVENINLKNNTKLMALLPGQLVKSIDTSNNKKLKYLDCSSCSLLESLDLSNNTELTTLLYDNCRLAGIDLTNNSKIETYSYYQDTSQGNVTIKEMNQTIDGCKSLQQWRMTLGYNWVNNKRTAEVNYYKEADGNYVYYIKVDDLANTLGTEIDLDRIQQWMGGVTIETSPNGNQIVVLKRSASRPVGGDITGTAEYSYKSNFNNNQATSPYARVSTDDRRYYPHFYIDWTASPKGLITAIDGVEATDEPAVTTAYGSIVVTGAEGAAIEVYSINGSRIYSGTNQTISVQPGMYLVRVGNKSHKVIVR